MNRRRVTLFVIGALLLAACWLTLFFTSTRADAEIICVELRSWVVFGQGRHLYALVYPPGHPRWHAVRAAASAQAPERDVPPTAAELVGVARVEYWKTDLRDGYSPPTDAAKAERIAKVQDGVVVRPMLAPPDNRLEAAYTVTARQARELTRDRVFTERYLLLGPNSTSGLRAAFRAAGLEFPPRVLAGRGVLGEFPGVDLSPGSEIPAEAWSMFGLPSGPESPAVWLMRSRRP